MNNSIEAVSYVTYEYNVYPRMVEKHALSNIVKTSINGADIKIVTKAIKHPELKEDAIIYIINVNNFGNRIAENIKIVDALNNMNFVKGSLVINGFKIPKHELKDGFFFKYLKPNECINIIFAAKTNTCGDIISLVSGFYYFINDKNEKVYRKALSNLNKITIDYSYLTFDIKYGNEPFFINKNKNFNVSLKNIGSKKATEVKFNVLLPNELKLNENSIIVNQNSINLDDEYGFFIGNLNPNESKQISFEIGFVEFKNRYVVPIAIFCSFYNLNEKNLTEKHDSEILRISISLTPHKTRNSYMSNY